MCGVRRRRFDCERRHHDDILLFHCIAAVDKNLSKNEVCPKVKRTSEYIGLLCPNCTRQLGLSRSARSNDIRVTNTRDWTVDWDATERGATYQTNTESADNNLGLSREVVDRIGATWADNPLPPNTEQFTGTNHEIDSVVLSRSAPKNSEPSGSSLGSSAEISNQSSQGWVTINQPRKKPRLADTRPGSNSPAVAASELRARERKRKNSESSPGMVPQSTPAPVKVPPSTDAENSQTTSIAAMIETRSLEPPHESHRHLPSLREHIPDMFGRSLHSTQDHGQRPDRPRILTDNFGSYDISKYAEIARAANIPNTERPPPLFYDRSGVPLDPLTLTPTSSTSSTPSAASRRFSGPAEVSNFQDHRPPIPLYPWHRPQHSESTVCSDWSRGDLAERLPDRHSDHDARDV